MPKGRPLEGAPGWRVVEREERPWRAGYVIVPLAILVGSLQVLIPSNFDRDGRPQDQRQAAPALAPAPAESEPGAPQAQRQPQQPRQSISRSAETRRPPMPDSRPLTSSGRADEAAAAGPAPIRVFIHHPAGAANALPAIQLAAFLQARGFDVIDIRPVDGEIERPSVRYFFDDDQREGQRLVEAIGIFYAKAHGRPPNDAANFSHFSPKPRRGNIEVWLPAAAARESHST